MYSLKALLLTLSTVGALTVPNSAETKGVSRRSVTPSSQGMNNGFFYSMWSDGTGDVSYTNGAAGQYSLSWTNSGDVVVGKGFQTGSARTLTYNADYEPNGISFLSVYGWFTDPLIEYYICENWGTGDPRQGDGMIKKGSFTSDGSNYDVYQHQQVNAPSIQGTTNFMQYWSIRTDRRTSGSINTANHFNYWKSVGMNTGTFNYQILATEGVKSSGKSTVTIQDGGSADAGSSAASSAPASSAPVSSKAAVASSAAAPPSVVPVAPVSSAAPSSKVTPASSVTAAAASEPAYSPAPVASQASSAASSAAVVSVVTVAPVESSSASVEVPAASTPYVAASSVDTPSSIATPEASSVAAPSSTCTEEAHTPVRPYGGRYGHHTPGTPTPSPHFGHHGHHGHRGHGPVHPQFSGYAH